MNFNPRPKPGRFINQSATEEARRRDGVCLYGLLHKDGCSHGLDGHHIQTRGSGGDDVKENIISLCRKHHDMAGARLISPEELLSILALYHGYKYPGIKPWTVRYLQGKHGI